MGENQASDNSKKIVVCEDGPYIVQGGLPLVHKTQIVSEFGEPLTWKKDHNYQSDGKEYCLCRCGQSSEKPYCDGTHRAVGFDGTERADTAPTAERQEMLKGKHIVVKRDCTLCTDSGFCGNQFTDVTRMVFKTEDTQVRAQLIAMIERCPSGALAYALEENGPDIEPDYPEQVAVTTEITSDGPIPGPLWVTGGVTVERADGKPFEIRNRVTLCNCGESACKPLCDGTHRQKRS
jgi:CDGSH-type Zn-finger protein